MLRLGALLHDVGKIGVPDDVLRKRGRLTPEEWEAIKAHPTAGARILQSMPFLARHIPIVELHHERPDGRGYPYGLAGDAIPLPARIVHVADAFDAMTSARAYRPARLPVEALDELRRGAGTDFDPDAVDALIAALSRQRTPSEGATRMGSSRARISIMSRHLWLFIVALLCVPHSARAQVSRVSLDAVVAADGDSGSSVARKPTSWIDVFGAVRLVDGLDLRVRPVVFRRSFDGEWRTRMYELALRYERPGRVGLRIDAGQLSSPLGLSILENRPDVNPVISQHSTLYLPVPRFEAGTPTTYLLAASYPLGAQVSASTSLWDARVAVLDSSPIRGRSMTGESARPRLANLVVGGGVTPRAGLRIGATFAHGGYAARSEVRDPHGRRSPGDDRPGRRRVVVRLHTDRGRVSVDAARDGTVERQGRRRMDRSDADAVAALVYRGTIRLPAYVVDQRGERHGQSRALSAG